MKRKRANIQFTGVKGVIILIILACLIVGYYFYLSNYTKARVARAEENEITAVQEILLRNLETNYPPTPKEVIKYYSELTQCFYNEELTEEDIDHLGAKAKELYDEELNEKNQDGQYLVDLREDIDDFNKQSIKISSYVLPASTDVFYFTEDGRECARLYCTYNIRQGTSFVYSREIFVLRRDADGHWKILGWDLSDEDINNG